MPVVFQIKARLIIFSFLSGDCAIEIDSPSHFQIKKQTKPQCCTLNCEHGYRASGIMAVNGTNGGLSLAVKDSWQMYPSGLEVDGLSKEKTSCTAWFYSPEAEAFDFRHYSTESYPLSSYEGFDEVNATPNGIGATSECRLSLLETVPSDEYITELVKRVNKPAVYVGTPEYYYEKKRSDIGA